MSFDWDSVLVTNDPDNKEVLISFSADGNGFYGSLRSGLGGADPGGPTETPEPPLPDPEPVPPVEPLPECDPHNCDAIKSTAFAGKLGGYYSGATVPANASTGEIYDQFGGGSGHYLVDFVSQDMLPKLVSEANSLPAMTALAGACYDFRVVTIANQNIISHDFPVTAQTTQSYSVGGSVSAIAVNSITQSVSVTPLALELIAAVSVKYSDGSKLIVSGVGAKINKITSTMISYYPYNNYGGEDEVTVQTPPSTPGVPDIWSFNIDLSFSTVSPDSVGLVNYPGSVAVISGTGSISKNGAVVASGFRAIVKSGYEPDKPGYYHYIPNKFPTGIIKERYSTSPRITGGETGNTKNCALSLSVGDGSRFAPTQEAYETRKAFASYISPSYCETLL